MKSVLVVGAGMAGAVHAREIADAGHRVHVIDKRPHIAGNCYDAFNAQGVRVHQYGPHLFHTSNKRVFDWLSRFTDWLPYEHRVKARLQDGRLVPMPVNLTTINTLFDRDFTTREEVIDFLATLTQDRGHIVSAEDWLYANMGVELTELFFRPYTEKMWDLKLAEVDAAVVKRVQLRYDNDDRYFPHDTIQGMPAQGYTALFERMLKHSNISVELSTAFDKSMLENYDFCFNSMPIDEYHNYVFGELPYRSIKFHHEEVAIEEAASDVVINYTDDRPFTRETWWHLIPGHLRGTPVTVTRTREEPCSYFDNERERYYPVKASDGRFDRLYEQYKALTEQDTRIKFIGRCGTYQYLDMHQVANQSLISVEHWLSSTRLCI